MFRSALRTVIFSALVAIFSIFLSCSGHDGRPNILLLVVDTLRADRLGIYGQKQRLTPNIDVFAYSALVFPNSVAASSLTIGTSPAILAGLYPSEHGYSNYERRISKKIKTLAEKLQAVGYKTFAISTNPHVSKKSGLAQGFDHFIQIGGWQRSNAERVNEAFLKWLNAQGEEPFFAMLWYIDPHSPYDPPARFVADHVPSELRHLIGDTTKRQFELIETDDQRRVMRGLYNAEVQYIDDQLGALFEELKERKMFDPAMIILTSDHGEELGHSYPDGTRIYGHGESLTDAVLNVPLLIKLPGSSRVGSVQTVARSIDLMPTVLSVADPGGTHGGRNLLATGPDALYGEPVLAELLTDQYGPYQMFSVQNSGLRMIRTDVFKQESFDPPRFRFYDLGSSGLLEKEVTPPRDAQTVLENALIRYRKDLRRFPTRRVKRDKAERKKFLEQLRALGYVETTTPP